MLALEYLQKTTMSNKNRERRRLATRKKRTQQTWLFLILGGILLMGSALFLWIQGKNATPTASIEVSGSPSLKTDRDRIDLGEQKLGNPVEVSFHLTNVGDKPLRFSKEPYVEVVEGC